MIETPPPQRRRFRLNDSFGALRHRDFRLFWVGALVSFIGTWIQTTGQQWLVWELTDSKLALGVITFVGAAPMFLLSPLGGWLADRVNKRRALVLSQSTLSLTAFTLAFAYWTDTISFGLIATLAFINGCVALIEIPTRQSIISHIVPEEDLANALPLNAATINTARIIGPAIGGFLLTYFNVGACYFVNGISFAAIILSVLAIRADISSTGERSATLRESLFEGIRHVARNPAFRTLVIMMMTTALFGLFYLSQVSSFADTVLGVGKEGYATLFIATGIGAVASILALAALSRKPLKGWLPVISMVGFGASMIALSAVAQLWQAVVCMMLIGAFGSGQMVGTNTALQYFSPANIRGRVISVHAWSLMGLSPVGALLFGWIGHVLGLQAAFFIGGTAIFLVGILVLIFGKPVKDLR